jgi:hypothetical protein
VGLLYKRRCGGRCRAGRRHRLHARRRRSRRGRSRSLPRSAHGRGCRVGAGRDRRSEFLCRGDGQRHGIAHLGHWLRWPSFTADSRFQTRRTVQRRFTPEPTDTSPSAARRSVAAIEALRHSAGYLRELRDRFLGPRSGGLQCRSRPSKRVVHKPPPPAGRSRNYVAIVTGWTTDEWASESPPQTADTTIPQGVPCSTRLANLILAPKETKRTAPGIMACSPIDGEQGLGDIRIYKKRREVFGWKFRDGLAGLRGGCPQPHW